MRYTIGGSPAKGRQSLGTIAVHLSKRDQPVVPHISPPGAVSGIAVVSPVDGLRIQTAEPECFEELAAAFAKAAEMLRGHAATEPVRDGGVRS